MNESYAIIQPIFDKYNANHDDPSFTPMQKYILGKLNEVQNELRSNNKQIETENTKVLEAKNIIEDIRFRNVNLEGQNQALLDMLLKLQEEIKND